MVSVLYITCKLTRYTLATFAGPSPSPSPWDLHFESIFHVSSIEGASC